MKPRTSPIIPTPLSVTLESGRNIAVKPLSASLFQTIMQSVADSVMQSVARSIILDPSSTSQEKMDQKAREIASQDPMGMLRVHSRTYAAVFAICAQDLEWEWDVKITRRGLETHGITDEMVGQVWDAMDEGLYTDADLAAVFDVSQNGLQRLAEKKS